MTPTWDAILDLDPQKPIDAALKAAPGRWAVYLMADADGRAVQLLSVKNLRASVKRRLTETVEGLSKKIDYRAVVRQIRYKRVDSSLESDLTYLDTARSVFPDSFRQIVTLRRAWWVQIQPDAPFPRWTRTDDPARDPTAMTFGPIYERGQAAKLVETLEDLFDLCRYYNILLQSPHGSPCAYKDMGKCPAPCDGSVSMQQYRLLADWSMRTMQNVQPEIDQQIQRMRDAAGELRFETAQKIKQFVDGLESLRKNEWRLVRSIDDFRYLCLQPGPAKGLVKLFSVTPAGVRCIACLRSEPKELMLRLNELQALTDRSATSPIDDIGLDRIGIVVKHLFSPKSAGIFIHADDLTDRAIASAYKQVAKREVVVEETDEEGVVAELAELTKSE